MTANTQWKRASVFALSLGLAACGSSSDDDTTAGRTPGNTPGEEAPAPEYPEVYDPIGMQPGELPHDAEVPDELATAVRAGYVAAGSLIATLDARMALQPMEWFLRQQANGVRERKFPAEPAQEGTEDNPYPSAVDVSCTVNNESDGGAVVVTGSGSVRYFHWTTPDEEILFGFGDCAPAGTESVFSSDRNDIATAIQSYTLMGSGYHRFELSNAEHNLYDGAVFSGGPFFRYNNASDVEGAVPMTFSNAPRDGEVTDPGSLYINWPNQGTQLTVLAAAEGVDEPFSVFTEKLDPTRGPQYLNFVVDNLVVQLMRDRGEDQDEVVYGPYELQSDSAELNYQTEPLRMHSGEFTVREVNGDAVYTFSTAADPAYVTITVDEDADGVVDAEGQVLQEFIFGRLRPQ